jgi:hypothetical protein
MGGLGPQRIHRGLTRPRLGVPERLIPGIPASCRRCWTSGAQPG